jgi:hypothetical protein
LTTTVTWSCLPRLHVIDAAAASPSGVIATGHALPMRRRLTERARAAQRRLAGEGAIGDPPAGVDAMLQIENETPFKTSLALFPDPEGIDSLYVAVLGTFSIGRGLAVADEQRDLHLADEPWGDPRSSSLKYAGEVHLCKPSTDVVLVGHAWAPGRRAAPVVDVTLYVGPVQKTVRVFGDRAWRGVIDPQIGPPAPFERMPLRYERAFGGILEFDPETRTATLDPGNPVGIGFARSRRGGEMSSRRLPNLEDPARLIARPTDRPPPAGFGFVAPSWDPRRLRAGTYDERWRKTRAPFLPADFDPGFFNAAHPDLVCKGHLSGGEPVTVLNASSQPRIQLRLPACRFDLRVHVAGVVERPRLALETVLIEPDEDRLSLLWRAAVRCDKRALKVSKVSVSLAGMELGGRAA